MKENNNSDAYSVHKSVTNFCKLIVQINWLCANLLVESSLKELKVRLSR